MRLLSNSAPERGEEKADVRTRAVKQQKKLFFITIKLMSRRLLNDLNVIKANVRDNIVQTLFQDRDMGEIKLNLQQIFAIKHTPQLS